MCDDLQYKFLNCKGRSQSKTQKNIAGAQPGECKKNKVMNRFQALMQQNEVLLRASIALRQISILLREGDYDGAMELQLRYKSELEPLLQGLSSVKRN